jgi:general secretion pathway protein E
MSRLRLVCTSDHDVAPVNLASAPVGIGRHPDNDVLIRDDLASRFHAVIEPNDEGQLCIKDLGSRNGTRMNGQRISEVLLSPGDIFSIGSHVFEIEKVEAPAPDASDTRGLDQTQEAPSLSEPVAVGADEEPVAAEADAPPRPRQTASRGASPYTDRRSSPKRANEEWAQSLRDILEALPPKVTTPDSIAVLDPRGNPSTTLASDASGPLAMRLLLLAASKSRATDIHSEPKGEMCSVRMRVDGQMIHMVDLPNEIGDLVNGIVRTACQMKQAAKDAVQDGSFSVRFNARRVDYRASLTPTIYGQKLVMRVLDSKQAPHKLADMHLPRYMHERLVQLAGQDTGLVLACGPTGCGKTTTLYNVMREVDRERRNVVTIEDPVEYYIDGVTQIPAARNQTFGDLLRSVLRQDPDVILVGEIRDQETARVAMQAAMTGHVVLSTVHTRDSIGAIFRLLDLGVEGYLEANSLDLVVAQRLIRVLCPHCKRKVGVTPGQQSRIGRFLDAQSEVYTATGCKHCLKTGFIGRQAIFEMLDFTEELRDIVLKEPTIRALRESIEKGVFTTLRQAGWRMAAAGTTSLEEVERVVGS